MSAHTRAAVARRTKAPAPGDERVIPVTLSTGAVDSDGESIDQASWRLERFLANPIALYQHDRWCEPIGYYRRVRVEGDALRADLVLYDDATSPEAAIVWRRYEQGGPVALSVGFACPRTADEERDGRTVRVLYDCELEECSVVSIPSNPEAVAEARAKAADLYRRHHRAAVAAHHTRKSPMNKFQQQCAKAGMSPEEFAAKAGMSPEELAKLMDGSAPVELAQKAAEVFQCSIDDLLDVATGVDPTTELPADGSKGAKVAELVKALGAKSIEEALVKAKALDAMRGEHADLSRRVKGLEARVAEDRAARDARERGEVMEEFRRNGVLTPAREKGKVGGHLKSLKTASEVRSYLDTLEPALDAAPPAREPALDAARDLPEADLTEAARATGISIEKLKASRAQLKAAARP